MKVLANLSCASGFSTAGKPVAPGAVKAHLTLTRPTGEVERMEFVVDKDSLKTRGTIVEPHVFEAVVVVETGSQTRRLCSTARRARSNSVTSRSKQQE
jgi:hypothetical protein